MKLAVLIHKRDQISFKVHRENVTRGLESLGVEILSFGKKGLSPQIATLYGNRECG